MLTSAKLETEPLVRRHYRDVAQEVVTFLQRKYGLQTSIRIWDPTNSAAAEEVQYRPSSSALASLVPAEADRNSVIPAGANAGSNTYQSILTKCP